MRNAQIIKTPAGDAMVLLPKADYDRLLAAARDKLEDEADARAAARILARLEKGEESTLPFQVVKRMRTENRIKVLREHRQMTQQDLADAAGMNRLYLSQIETGRATGGLKTLTRIAKVLQAPLDMLLPAEAPERSRRTRK
ncbi:MAG TPA: helix-turn-helix transcriptional regulator [Dongiaceae bacterium]|nr:helix-turn-helix transcriptional regulator [Dongiaceae bacterium]